MLKWAAMKYFESNRAHGCKQITDICRDIPGFVELMTNFKAEMCERSFGSTTSKYCKSKIYVRPFFQPHYRN